MITIDLPTKKRIFATADTHYGHRAISKYCRRPWLNAEELAQVDRNEDFRVSDETLRKNDDAIVEGINSTVEADDILLHMGDVAWKYDKLREFRSRIKVKRVIVILGNHDDDYGMRKVFPECYERAMVSVGEQKAVLDHYPGDCWLGSHRGNWLLYGHVHGVGDQRRLQNPSWLLSQDCGVDIHNFRPWNWHEELIPLFNSRKSGWHDWRLHLRGRTSKDGSRTLAPDETPYVKGK